MNESPPTPDNMGAPAPEPSPYSDLPASGGLRAHGDLPGPPPGPPPDPEYRRKAKKRVEKIQRELDGLVRDAMKRNRLRASPADVYRALEVVVRSVQHARDKVSEQPQLTFD